MRPSLSLILPEIDIPGVTIGVTTRDGGVGKAPFDTLNLGDHVGDNPAHVRENRRRLQSVLPEQPICWLRQVHGNRTVLADHTDCSEADAHWTTQRRTPLAILTADCLPVVIAAKDASCVGIAHAGWRGACGGVLEATINRMCKAGAARDNITAVIGPCIRQHSYQVGDDLRDEALASTDEAVVFFATDQEPGKYRFDLAGYVAMRLATGGIAAIHDCQRDTYSESEQFFSHRFATHAGDSDSGRLISVIALQPFSTTMQET